MPICVTNRTGEHTTPINQEPDSQLSHTHRSAHTSASPTLSLFSLTETHFPTDHHASSYGTVVGSSLPHSSHSVKRRSSRASSAVMSASVSSNLKTSAFILIRLALTLLGSGT